jgi:2C-methyl-D-erythritol 2,4-cyclodiphosphate synthase
VSDNPTDIINDCIAAINGLSPDSVDFVDQVIELVTSKAALFSKMDNPIWNLRTLSKTFLKHLSSPAGISTLDHIKIYEGMYGANGSLRDTGFDHYDALSSHSKLIAGLYYFIQTDSSFINISKRHTITKQVTEIALEGGQNWKALKVQLELIDNQRPQAKLVASIPGLLKNLAEHLYMDSDAVLIQKLGGVERLKEVGADIDHFCQSVLSRLSVSSLKIDGLSQVHRFIVEATDELHTSGAITRDESNDRHSRMLRAILSARVNKPKKESHERYRPMMLELAPHLNKKHASDLIPRLSKYLSLDEIKSHLKEPLSLIDPPKFKVGLTKHVDAGMQYDLVVKLGLDGLFEHSELQRLKGAKLESALGL